MLRHCAVAALAAAMAAVAAAPASAATHRCSTHRHVDGRLGAIATVIDVSHMRCATARRTIRRQAGTAGPSAFGPDGSRFRLGRWKCTVFLAIEEDHRARCQQGARVFRVDYGS